MTYLPSAIVAAVAAIAIPTFAYGDATPPATQIPAATASTAGGGGPPTTLPSTSAPTTPIIGGGTAPAARAPKLAAKQKGPAVHGAVDVTHAGSRLSIDVRAKRSAFGTGRSGRSRVGHAQSTVKAGTVSFRVKLNAAAKKALREKGKLPVSVKLTVKPPRGAAYTLTRAVTITR